MEEAVGKLWDKWLTQQVSTDFTEAAVNLSDIQSQLLLFYRAMGGVPAKTIEAAAARKLVIRRSTLQKIAGSHQKFILPWQDERSLRLPPTIALFADRQLNQALYFWLAALAAHLPTMEHWLRDNQAATRRLITKYPGLEKSYHLLTRACLAARPNISALPETEQSAEKALQSALKVPGIITEFPSSRHHLSPVSLWLYPPLTIAGPSRRPIELEQERQKRSGQQHQPELKRLQQRKQAQYVDDEPETDGLQVFQAESLMTWTEQVNLDRSQSEQDDDDNIAAIAQDLDIITLSRQRKANAARIRFGLDLPAEQNDDLRLGEGLPLPEWNFKQQRLVENVCLLQTMLADEVKPVNLTPRQRRLSFDILQLFSVLGLSRSRRKAQSKGDEIDLDAWLDNYVQPVKDSNRQNFFIDSQHRCRDVSCLILADLSLSTEGYINNEQRVIDVIRDSLIVFAEALNKLGDEFAIYGFSSVRSQHIRYHILKNFEMAYNDHVRGRITRIEPGYYTRMGAAIRQSSKLLSRRDSSHKILLIITDGKPNDLDHYEGRYGVEDTRQAIIEAKQLGLTPYCVTIDQEGHDYLPYLFGYNSFSIITDATQLPRVLPKIYLNLTAH